MSERPRPFFLPLIGFTLLFALFGPAIGGVLFAPIVFLLAAPIGAATVGSVAGAAFLFGHALALLIAYVVGIGPAAAAGFLYGLWDAAAPPGAPRALAAAIIGAVITYCVFLWFASLGADIEAIIGRHATAAFQAWIHPLFPRGFDVTLRDTLVACGAVAGLACAMAASLLGLTTRGALAPSPTAPSGGV
jgi:uncharacterized membrane protein YeaQ/YmgE (transglycosylase-associated protein family)